MSSARPKPPERKQSLDEVNMSRDIKEVAKRAIAEHEVLKRKYSQKEEQAKQLVDELEETKSILSRLESVSGQVVQEYSEVQTKLEIEQQCRVEAEKYATKTVREIKELKRKSQMVFQQNGIDFSQIVDIDLTEDPGDPSLGDGLGDEGGHEAPLVKEYQAQIEMLKDELFKAKKDLAYAMEERDVTRDDLNGTYYQISQLKEQLKHKSVAHEKTMAALQERDNIINQLKRVSALVYDEFNEVQTLYEKESAMREQAEQMASEYYVKNKEAETFKRQSTLMLSEAISGDDKLFESMNEVEKLTKQMEEDREKHKQECHRLREELELSQDRERMETLNNKLSIAQERNEFLEKQAKEVELKNKQLAYELKEALSRPSLPNIPPPPPPPPVPIPPKNPLELLHKILGRKQKVAKDDRHLDNYQKQFESAMQDMISRIKKGQVKLKPTKVNGKSEAGPKTLTKPGTTQAVKELDNILNNLKNTKNRPRKVPIGPIETKQSSQLTEIMEKRRHITNQPQPPTSQRPSPRPAASQRSPSKLNKSTSLDGGAPLPNRTHNVPPRVAPKRAPLTSTSSEPPQVPEPLYSTVHADDPPSSPPSTPSSTLSSIISTSSQEIEIQNNPAFIHDSGDERPYASADYSLPVDAKPPPLPPTGGYGHEKKFTVTDFGEGGDYSLVEEKPIPSPRRQVIPKQVPEPYYSEVNNL